MTSLFVVLLLAESVLKEEPRARSASDCPPFLVCGRCVRPKSAEPESASASWFDRSKRGLATGLASGVATGVVFGRRLESGGGSPGALFRGGKPWIAWGAAGGLLAAHTLAHDREEPPKVTAPWVTLRPPNVIDASIRNGIGGKLSPKARQFFDGASYVTLGHLVGQPLGLRVSGSGRADRWQDVLIPFEAAVITGFATDQVKHLVHRPRPFAYFCEPPNDKALKGDDAQLSFFSGHTSIAFALAAATSGVAAARQLPNARALRNVSYSVAGATGLFRILADRHYASDVVVGGLVGWVTGRTLAKWHAKHGVASKPTTAAPAAISATLPLGNRGVLNGSFGDGFAVRVVVVR